MEGIDLYRLTGMCAIVVMAWCVQVIGWSTFSEAAKSGPPEVNVVDFNWDFSGEDANRPLAELGYDLSKPLVSAARADELRAEHQREKWLGLLAGIAGTIGVFVTACKIWEDRLVAIACVFAGPLAIAWGFQRSG